MKVLKINTNVELNTGIQLPSGVILVFTGMYISPGENPTQLNVELNTKVYSNLASFQSGLSPVRDTKDFSSNFYNVEITLADFSNNGEDLITVFLNIIKNKLEEIYPGQIEIITIE